MTQISALENGSTFTIYLSTFSIKQFQGVCDLQEIRRKTLCYHADLTLASSLPNFSTVIVTKTLLLKKY